MGDLLCLQVRNDVDQGVEDVPDFAFTVRCVDFATFADFDLQTVLPVLVKQANGEEGRAEFVGFLRVVAHEAHELWVRQQLADFKFADVLQEVFFLLDHARNRCEVGAHHAVNQWTDFTVSSVRNLHEFFEVS